MPNITTNLTSQVPGEAGVTAELNPAPETVLFHVSGKHIRVPNSDIPFWLDQGFKYELVDPHAAAEELKAIFPAALNAVLAWIVDVERAGSIDTASDAAKATADRAMVQLEQAWAKLTWELQRRYPVMQGEAVPMVHPDGTPDLVDPMQVEHYEKVYGWKRQ